MKRWIREYGYQQIARDAMAFVLETGHWDHFLSWHRMQAVSEISKEWNKNPSLLETRKLWMSNSPDKRIRRFAARYEMKETEEPCEMTDQTPAPTT